MEKMFITCNCDLSVFWMTLSILLMSLLVLLISLTVLRRLGGQLWEGLLLPLNPYPCEYCLQTPLGPTSCHNWVVPRVMPLDLCGLLEAEMVKSVTRQVVQGAGWS